MTFEGFVEINTTLGWEDITDRLIGFGNISESPRDKRTGKAASSTFNIVVRNEDGFWFAPEKVNALGKRINDGEDTYVKTLRHRRVRVGVYVTLGQEKVKQAWATGRIVGFSANTDDLSVTLKCETLEAEAMDTCCDVKSGEDVIDEDYGIRGHRIDYDGDFEIDPYTLYKRKETYEDSDDYSTALECHQAVRINDILKHIRNVLDIAGEESNIDEVLRKAYYEDAGTGEMVRRRACDQVKVLDNSHLGAVGEPEFRLAIADPDGNICFLYEGPGTGALKVTYLGYYNYHTNTWQKWGSAVAGYKKFRTIRFSDLAPKGATQLGWWNSYTKTFQWIGTHSTLLTLHIWDWNPATDALYNVDIESYIGAGSNPNALCFAQTTGANGGVGSLFVSTNYMGAPPGGSNEIYELDVRNLGVGLGTHAGPIQDPNAVTGDGAYAGPGAETIVAWGPPGTMIITAAAIYDSILDPDKDDVYGDGIGTCTTKPARGLVVRLDRSGVSGPPFGLGAFYGAIWIDLYGDHPSGAGTGILIWCDTTMADDVNQGQTVFKVLDPDGNHKTFLPLYKRAANSDPDTKFTLINFPDEAWGTNFDSASHDYNDPLYPGGVSGNGESRHAYFDELGGPGVIVQRDYEDLETGNTERWPRFYWWANRYYGANGPGKLQSTDGKTRRAENTSVQGSRYGDHMFGDYRNCLVATGLTFSRGRDGRLLVFGGFYKPDDTPDTNYLFAYGWDVQWTLSLLDVRNLTIADLLSFCAQLTGYEWWFGARGELNFIDRGFEKARQEWTPEKVDNVNYESRGYDYKELINYVKVTPYEVTYQDSALGGAVLSKCFYSQQAGKLRLNWIRISPTNTHHKKIKVQILNVGFREYGVYEWDDATNDWTDDLTEGEQRIINAWTDPNGEYTIPAYPDGWVMHGAPELDDYWLFWTVEPLWGLEPIDEARARYEAMDVNSERKYGRSELAITRNRFVTRKDIDLLTKRILRLFRHPKRIFSLEIPLSDELPAIGDTVYFADPYMQIELTQAWRVVSISKQFGTAEAPAGVISLRVEEIL